MLRLMPYAEPLPHAPTPAVSAASDAVGARKHPGGGDRRGLPAGRPRGGVSGAGGQAPGPFGISGNPGVHAGQQIAGQHPGGRFSSGLARRSAQLGSAGGTGAGGSGSGYGCSWSLICRRSHPGWVSASAQAASTAACARAAFYCASRAGEHARQGSGARDRVGPRPTLLSADKSRLPGRRTPRIDGKVRVGLLWALLRSYAA
jgi:hypothetical protein